MVLMRERIGKLLEYLQEQIYPRSCEIQDYRMKKTEETFSDVGNLDTSDWEVLTREQLWGGHREYYWFETKVVIPAEFDGECVVYELMTGREGEWDATNPQFSIFVDGKRIQGLDVNHREIILTERPAKGRSTALSCQLLQVTRTFPSDFVQPSRCWTERQRSIFMTYLSPMRWQSFCRRMTRHI